MSSLRALYLSSGRVGKWRSSKRYHHCLPLRSLNRRESTCRYHLGLHHLQGVVRVRCGPWIPLPMVRRRVLCVGLRVPSGLFCCGGPLVWNVSPIGSYEIYAIL